MSTIRYSEPYQPTGGLAAEGVINQLGRPDIEPLEVLVREAVQNCWDARRDTELSIRIEIGRRNGDAGRERATRRSAPGSPLGRRAAARNAGPLFLGLRHGWARWPDAGRPFCGRWRA